MPNRTSVLFALACLLVGCENGTVHAGYDPNGQPWTTTTLRLMGADGKPCAMTFGMKNDPLSGMMLSSTSCPFIKQHGIIRGWSYSERQLPEGKR